MFSCRGLPNIPDTPRALDAYNSDKAKKVFSDAGVFTERELESRYHIKNEMYTKVLQIEARVLGDLAMNHVIPTAVRYQNVLLENLNGIKSLNSDINLKDCTTYPYETLTEISSHINSIKNFVNAMIEERKKANVIEDVREKAVLYCDQVKPYFDKIRYHADKLEVLIDDEIWPLPKYRELLFIR